MTEDPLFTELYGLVKTYGPGATFGLIFLVLWWRSEQKYEKAMAAREQMLERMIVAMEGTKSALASLERLFGKRPSS